MVLNGFVQKSLGALLFLALAGCSTIVGTEGPIVYPLPPEQARFEWIGTFVSENSFKKEGFMDLLQDPYAVERFAGPVGVTVADDGRILVNDLYSAKLKVLDLENKDISEFTSYPFVQNAGIATDQQGNVYVANGNAQTVVVLSREGTYLRNIGNQDNFKKASYVEVNDELGRLYVSDGMAHNIKVFALDGEFLFTIGEGGQEPGQFFSPQGMAFDSKGQLFVADMLNARIQVFSADGEYLRHFGERGNFAQQFENPKDLSFDSDGNLYVVDSRRPNFRVFTPEGQLLLAVGGDTASTEQLGFLLPMSIYVDSSDRVIISDLLAHRVTVWQYLSKAYLQRTQQQ